jgi:hypothetical protein
MLLGGPMNGFTNTNSALIILNIITLPPFHRKLATLPETNLSTTEIQTALT